MTLEMMYDVRKSTGEDGFTSQLLPGSLRTIELRPSYSTVRGRLSDGSY